MCSDGLLHTHNKLRHAGTALQASEVLLLRLRDALRLSQPAWPSHAAYQQCLEQLQAAGPLASVLAVEAPVPNILQVNAASTHGCYCACSEGSLLLAAVIASLQPLQLTLCFTKTSACLVERLVCT